MARPREFDRDDALKKAQAIFWRKGYAATSTADLLEAMAIGRQSMYDTFGDKRSLYLEALDDYNRASVAAQLRQLAAGAAPLATIEALLLAFATDPGAARGCLGVNAICEFGLDDADVVRISEDSGQLLRSALEAQIRAAQEAGQIAPAHDARGAAQFLLATLVGMKVSARAGADTIVLRGIAGFAIGALKATPG
jgi:AcrR family transcriptional regulator